MHATINDVNVNTIASLGGVLGTREDAIVTKRKTKVTVEAELELA